jgi:hypothetical protein
MSARLQSPSSWSLAEGGGGAFSYSLSSSSSPPSNTSPSSPSTPIRDQTRADPNCRYTSSWVPDTIQARSERVIHFWLSKQAQFSVLYFVPEPDQHVLVQGIPKSEIDVESVNAENPIVRHLLWAFLEWFSRCPTICRTYVPEEDQYQHLCIFLSAQSAQTNCANQCDPLSCPRGENMIVEEDPGTGLCTHTSLSLHPRHCTP